ncbi:MAG: glycosyltransferase family 1 protein [Gammaproteobacteria bacterium]|nr:MAG: glycosyltransferase family 1 protein [Gammaproteobacteria bacterium]
MRIVIDMQGAQTESCFRGIGRYTMSLTKAIVRNRGEHEIILVLNGLFPDTIEPIRAAFDDLLPQKNILVWHAPGPVRECEAGNEWRREVAECLREAFLSKLQPDVVWISSLFEGYIDDAVTSIGVFASQLPTVATLYDLIPLLSPKTYLDNDSTYATHYQQKVEYLKRANLWLAISESSAVEGQSVLNISSNAIVNISTACDSIFQPLDISEDEKSQLLRQFGITKPFILYTGGADPRKNLNRLIRAYSALPNPLRNKYQLVFAGKIHIVAELLRIGKKSGLAPEQLVFTGYVSDEALVRLTNLCEVFIFPSLHEGFGMPALEAMACGAAVISSNTSSLPEVIGRDDALFDPNDESSITQKLRQVLENNDFRDKLAKDGLEQARTFSWDESARRAISSFERMVGEPLKQGIDVAVQSEIIPRLLEEIARLSISNMPSDQDCLKVASSIAKNHPAPRRHRKLFVDISELVQRDARTGIQRVTRAILCELHVNPAIGFEVEAVYATIDQPGYRTASHFINNLLGQNADCPSDSPINAQPGDIFLGLDLQHHTTRVQEQYLLQLKAIGVRVWFVVYDLLPILFPEYWPKEHAVHAVHEEWLRVITRFDGVACISRAVADELSRWAKENGIECPRPLKIDWFHLGADVGNSAPSKGLPPDAGTVLEQLSGRCSFLMVGTLEPRKGHAHVLDTFERLWADGEEINLVIVGKEGWLVESLIDRLRSHAELNKHLFWLEGISDEYLEKVYASSTCLIAASYGEGFGLPLIEAAQHKLPIIARDIPVFREVAGKNAYYFSADEPDSLAKAMKEWLELYGKQSHPKSDDMPWLTWEESARQLLDVLLKDEVSWSKKNAQEEALSV